MSRAKKHLVVAYLSHISRMCRSEIVSMDKILQHLRNPA